MTINRSDLSGLLRACKELGEHGPELKAHADYHLAPMIAQAQAAPEAEPVEYQQLSRYGNWDRIDKATFDLGLLGHCPERFRVLYTAPQHDAELIELLREARDSLENNVGMQDGYIDYDGVHALKIRIDAKLATLKVKP